jgi:excisionase family DNA binding protein
MLKTRTQLFRIPEVAKTIQGTQRFVEREIAAGRLPVVRLSRKFVRVRPEDLEAYLAKYVVAGDAKQ